MSWKLSSGTLLLRLMVLQSTQRWTITNSPWICSMPTGSISPWQVFCLSPGLISTCLLYRHLGQWLVYPLPRTSWPQLPHWKSSIFRWKSFKFDWSFLNCTYKKFNGRTFLPRICAWSAQEVIAFRTSKEARLNLVFAHPWVNAVNVCPL